MVDQLYVLDHHVRLDQVAHQPRPRMQQPEGTFEIKTERHEHLAKGLFAFVGLSIQHFTGHLEVLQQRYDRTGAHRQAQGQPEVSLLPLLVVTVARRAVLREGRIPGCLRSAWSI